MLPLTCTVLLEALLHEDPDTTDGTWAEFDRRYRPVLFAFAQRAGLADVDAQDVAQDVLATFVEEYRAGRYDRERGRLRSWLFAIAQARVARHRRRAGRAPAQGLTAVGEVPAEDALEGLWEEEWRHALLGAALDELRSGARKGDRSPWVFEQVVVAGRSPADVARELGGSAESVRAAKHRALKKLRTILARLEDEW